MRNSFLFLMLVVFFSACHLKLSDEEKRAIKEELENQRITRVTESEIMSKAHETGRLIMYKIDSLYALNAGYEVLSEELARLSAAYHARIEWAGNDDNIPEKYRELMEAYSFIVSSNKEVLENLQVLKSSNLLYTRPNLQISNDTTILKGLWNIELERKYIVLELP